MVQDCLEMHVTELHERSVDEFLARIDRLPGDAWHRATPCPDWDVRALVNHLVHEDVWTVPLMGGATLDEVGDRFEGDLLGDDPAGNVRAACEAAVAAVASGVVAGRTVHLSFGDTPAEEYAYQLAADHLVHAWDLAAAVDGDRHLDTEVVDACSAWFSGREQAYRDAGVIGPRPRNADPDDPQGRLLVAFGRHPDWRHPGPDAR
jgi:uncharacterized protein (TIGR03086 family)